ncbi:hypothetical protein LTR20_010187 [Exophiala xenobiotica]|nr:hypothetical protein LTS13_006985 [Exophiala xenobiotica]KAK5397347.1 hypothetical protein LTR79_004860 [Exophiala xenobiotica]KAK5410502.1 hypothetical protein LTR90_008683 [Exophiala xenobiotica]KAK5454528.1 hypothetical protein LTR20_010187 [Exophiala xenobiotica]KAK5475929.1 hypothetical protein LTR26_009269 [Exophiala xenobiotica]
MKPSFVLLPAFLFAVRALADVPPACLLGAVNTQDNPTDLSSLCGNEATQVQKAINSLCTSTNKSAAQSAFIATCSSAGSSVAPYTATATSAATTNTSSGSFVYTTVVDGSTIVTSAGSSPTSGAGASAEATGTSATNSASESAASATGNAASEQRQVGSFAAAVIAIAGVVAVL